jgi:hypothetical protein
VAPASITTEEPVADPLIVAFPVTVQRYVGLTAFVVAVYVLPSVPAHSSLGPLIEQVGGVTIWNGTSA